MWLSMIRFLHVASAMGLFAAIGMEGGALRQLRVASDAAGVRASLAQMRMVQVTGMVSTLVLLLSGVFLATVEHQWGADWVDSGLVGLVLVALIGASVSGPRVRRLARAVDTGAAPSAIGAGDRALLASYAARTAILLVIVFLMTVHP